MIDYSLLHDLHARAAEDPMSPRLQEIQSNRLANTLGAFAIALSDRIQLGLSDRFDIGPSDAAALVVLARHPEHIERLSRHVGLSHSATVRLVDRLEESGLVSRAPGRDARSVSLRLTTAGRRRARAILAERDQIVSEILAPLGNRERHALSEAVEEILEDLAVDWPTGMHICRLCELDRCEAEAACPVALGAEEAEGRSTW